MVDAEKIREKRLDQVDLDFKSLNDDIGILGRLCDEKGMLRRFLNVYVNSEDIRFLENQATSLGDGDEVSIVPAVAGG